ncbi:MAG: RES family NAD+ phosphorylase [Verrucomicrobiota bacterium]
MNPSLSGALQQANIQSYVIELPVDNAVSYRYTGDPFGSSKNESRYNESGVNAFYIGDSEETARHEKRFKLDASELYHVGPGSIHVFDAQRFAQDYSFGSLLTGSVEEGSYKFCQELATHLTGSCGISGVYYPSRQMALSGKTGWCVALLPQASQLVDGKLYIFERRA